ncbi:MAG: VWA domain-containing protein [Bacteroidia bacterium]
MLKSSMKKMLEYMRPQDRVAVVTYSGEARVVLPSTSATEKERIIQAIDNLQSGGQTNALNGAVAAYRVAQRAFTKEGNNRIIMASDGYFRIPEALPRLVQEKASDNILLSISFLVRKKRRLQPASFASQKLEVETTVISRLKMWMICCWRKRRENDEIQVQEQIQLHVQAKQCYTCKAWFLFVETLHAMSLQNEKITAIHL